MVVYNPPPPRLEITMAKKKTPTPPQTKLKLVVKEPGKPAEVREVDATDVLGAMQLLVGGYVQAVPVGPGVTILVDEDGLAKNKSDNCGFVGTFVFVEDVLISEDEGYDWGSLSDENVGKALRWCQRYGSAVHPDRSGGISIVFGAEEIKKHREELAVDAESKLMEWQAL